MAKSAALLMLVAAGLAAVAPGNARAQGTPPSGLDSVQNIVVIFAENRSFDNLYGSFPGANGLSNATPESMTQLDRDGSVLKVLPPVWNGLTAKGVTPAVTQAQTENLPNKPYAIDDPGGFNVSLGVITQNMVHRFYQNQMQINGGKNNMFVAYGDSGAMVMGHFDGSKLPMWQVAKKYTLADNFFMGAFGGSFMNHIYLVCACVGHYPNADETPASKLITVVNPDNVSLKLADNSPKSALDGIPKYVKDGDLTPDFYAVNTMQPPYQPSRNKPAPGGDPAYADPSVPTTLPPQTDATIGDRLTEKGVSWAYYSGAWKDALDGDRSKPVPNFQFHHQPFNYFAHWAPGTKARDENIRDAGLGGVEFIKDIDAGKLPQVAFYKPQGNLNEHPGYADVQSGDQHIADVISHLEKSPQWAHMVVVVTYDENGGIWDHVAPPKGDRWGPGTRIPAIIISPFSKRGFVDHTQYDTTSILRLISKRFDLPPLPGVVMRDEGLKEHGSAPMGDLTNALTF
ncbi:MAG TPA: acid phosphatase [Pseudolabrys sp.]|nr:acid phosphatase [Pseudolabrys sp.]